MIFWKTSEVAKEEARLAELRKLYENGDINSGEYMNAINQLKGIEQPTSSPASIMDTVQLGFLVALVGAGIYAFRQFK